MVTGSTSASFSLPHVRCFFCSLFWSHTPLRPALNIFSFLPRLPSRNPAPTPPSSQARVNGLKSCVIVLRILRDMCNRHPVWEPLKGWVSPFCCKEIMTCVWTVPEVYLPPSTPAPHPQAPASPTCSCKCHDAFAHAGEILVVLEPH